MKFHVNDDLFHVEHFGYSFFRITKYILIALVFFIGGCKSENPEPEKLDPIYGDLVKQHESYLGLFEKEKETVEKNQTAFEKTVARTIDRRTALKDLQNSQEKVRKYEQLAEYYRIAAIKRKAEAKVAYRRAFAAGKVWPEKKEYESYLLDKKMREAPRTWSQHLKELPGLGQIGAGEGGKEGGEEKKAEGGH